MKVMLDTNIIILAALFPNGRAARAFLNAMTPLMKLFYLISGLLVNSIHFYS